MNGKSEIFLTGKERTFPEDEIIVSKTDPRGIITYVNDVFSTVSGFEEHESLGKPHSLIRHPHMPRCVFKLLWDTLEAGNEIFAYVNNRAKNGDNYWVFAHVTPCFDRAGRIISYHSSRRSPKRSAVEKVIPLYKQLLEIEQNASDRKIGMETSFRAVIDLLQKGGISYDRFVLSL
jgi:PAS domain S-box-containing protein